MEVLLECIEPLQTKVMRENGYEGEEGYLRLQVALAEHSTDDTVAYNNNSMTQSVFRRAGINLPQ